jgi:hypothetical protein
MSFSWRIAAVQMSAGGNFAPDGVLTGRGDDRIGEKKNEMHSLNLAGILILLAVIALFALAWIAL